jgi:hypothetical protein
MAKDTKSAVENNSFFDGDYKQYAEQHRKDSCATGTLTLNDIDALYGAEEKAMLKDYETASLRLSENTRSRRERTDRLISELTGAKPQDLTENYIFDPEELTIGELIAINEEIVKQQNLLAEQPKDPYLSDLIAVTADRTAERISIISVPEEAVSVEDSPFIAVEDL